MPRICNEIVHYGAASLKAKCILCKSYVDESEMKVIFKTGFIRKDNTDFPMGICQQCSPSVDYESPVHKTHSNPSES
ncbi:hypothetical protein ALPO108162_09645 [Alicyclobacillus pomorum]